MSSGFERTPVQGNERWLPPEGVQELLPPTAQSLEEARRAVLDLFRSWGYQLVFPPLVEHLDALLTGTGSDLDLQTFKFVDQLTGRMLGMRADMTVQVARIDARHMPHDRPVRLCYVGTVLRTRPDGLGGGRTPVQMGAELYGHAGLESDLEIISLLVESLQMAGVPALHLDLGHVGIFRTLARQAGLDQNLEHEVHEALQRKARPELEEMLRGGEAMQRLLALSDLSGDASTLDEAASRFAGAGDAVLEPIEQLRTLYAALARRYPELGLHVDLAELRGYAYHTGTVFAAYTPSVGQEIARGGRYDDIGQAFGKPRPATGFSADLKLLVEVAASNGTSPPIQGAILAPDLEDDELRGLIRRLRQAREVVIGRLPGCDATGAALGCDRELVKSGEGWRVVPLGR
ncbi:MAG: ATP phosphoribosyltransferase regulatory subunit [Gammaproteobacteria bacterium]|nr:ATP phosphoribosyltransferase regulatory subunit [Gammaproteobacteria bacterium]